MTPMTHSLSAEHAAALSVLPDLPTREQIEDFGFFLQSLETPETPDIPTAHHLAGDLYGRSVVINAETYLVGLPHKEDHINVCVGDITVWTERGKRRLTGAHILPAKAGDMRVGFAHSDTTWVSFHVNRTGGSDIQAIEDSLVEHADRLMTRRRPQLEAS